MEEKTMKNCTKYRFTVSCCALLGLFLFLAAPSMAAEKKLPENLKWISNNDEPLFADSEAKQGGVYRLSINSFPLTMRTVGPDSNGSFRGWLLGNAMSLVDMHPDTRKNTPALATAWAYGDDNKTVYFKLDRRARWSDGAACTAADYTFLMEMMRSKNITAPWYNDFYTNTIAGVTVYDDYTISVQTVNEHNRDELMDYANLAPRPRHFYKGVIPEDYVRRYNWKPEPTLGPYHVGDVKKGKYVTLNKTKDWWAYSNPYYQHRYNVETIILKVIRDNDIALKHFHKGDLDSYSMLFPSLWHNKAKGELYDKGYIQKAWLFNQTPQGAGGIWLNLNVPLLQDINVRRGIAHSLNFGKVIDQVLMGDYVREQNFGSGHGKYDDPAIRAPKYDIEQAIAAFQAAGFDKLGADGIRVNEKNQRLSIELTYLTKMHNPRVVVLKEEAKKCGLEIELKLIDGATGFKALLEKKFQATLLMMSSSLIPHYWEYFHSVNAKPQTNNFTGYKNEEMDKLIDAYDKEFDIGVKASLSHKIQQMIHESYTVIPGYGVPFSRAAYWRYIRLPEHLGPALSDDITDATGMGYGLFWIDKEMQAETRKAMKAGKGFEPVTIIDRRFLEMPQS